MATIRKYRGKFNVQIRKKGYPFISKSFVSLTVAKCKSSKDMEQSDLQIKRDIWIVSPD